MSKVTVYNWHGSPLAELDVAVNRSWIKSGVGSAAFQISGYSPQATRENLEFGNYILIEHEKLPAWVGIIVPPRTWTGRRITVNCISAMGIFARRRGVDGQRYYGSAGHIITSLINFSNTISDTRIRIGEIQGGKNYSMSLSAGVQLYENLKQMVDVYPKFCLDFVPDKESHGNLIIYANWREYTDTLSNATLHEGTNIEAVDPILSEQGQIVNDYFIQSSGLSAEDRISFNVKDEESIAQYGIWQKADKITTNYRYGNTGLPEDIGETMLEKLKEPRRLYNFKVLDIGNTWKDIRLDVLTRFVIPSSGFSGSGFGSVGVIRPVGMVYADSGALEITCEEV